VVKAAIVTVGIVVTASMMSAASGHAATPASHHKAPAIGDKCLIGTWRDTMVTQSTVFEQNLLTMTGKGGDFDHIHASGIDRDDWTKAHAVHGAIGNDPVDEVIRGINKLSFVPGAKPGSLEVTELGWSAGNSATFTYQGQTTAGSNQQTGTGAAYYTCTAKKLTWLSAVGTVVGHETRVSRKP
jgi:hypothetical protein